jgi:hypothetical protein
MIPRAEYEQAINVDPDKVETPSFDRILYGVPCIHEYEPRFFLDASWKGAAEALEAERREIARLDASCDDETAFSDGCFEVEWEYAFELGVSGLAEALCAAGCPTFSSCRGHDGQGTGSPWIVCGCDSARLQLLLDAVRGSGCSAENGASGEVVIFAPSVSEAVGLGFELLTRRAAFDELSPVVDYDELRAAVEEEWGDEE